VVHGGAGYDTISANGTMYGGGGRDTLNAGGLGKQELWGGAGDDVIYAGPGRDVIHPGRGEDEVWLANEHRGKTAWKDRARDTVWSRDGESDGLRCDADSPADQLLVDGLDWPRDFGGGLCRGVSRSSLPLPLPSAVASPDYEIADGTWVWIFCPWDGLSTCAGTVTVRVAGGTLGPLRFRIRAGHVHSYKLGDAEFGSDEDAVPTLVTLRIRDRRGRLHRVAKTVWIDASPYS
jgi:Ca2+-binding RTX toxin-like protein